MIKCIPINKIEKGTFAIALGEDCLDSIGGSGACLVYRSPDDGIFYNIGNGRQSFFDATKAIPLESIKMATPCDD